MATMSLYSKKSTYCTTCVAMVAMGCTHSNMATLSKRMLSTAIAMTQNLHPDASAHAIKTIAQLSQRVIYAALRCSGVHTIVATNIISTFINEPYRMAANVCSRISRSIENHVAKLKTWQTVANEANHTAQSSSSC